MRNTKAKNNKIVKIIALSLISMLSLLSSSSYGALQANNGTPATKTINDWIVAVRQMEAAGGTLGKSETINTTGLLATTDSNGMDCHMEKNTEYGAMIILSASAYGKPTKINNGETTTGNETGVKMNINKEMVAASGGALGQAANYKNANGRYKHNDYGDTAGGKYHLGDAMNIGGWHGSGATNWGGDPDYTVFLRSYSGSVFSYYRGNNGYGSGDGSHQKSWASRAVVVIGENL